MNPINISTISGSSLCLDSTLHLRLFAPLLYLFLSYFSPHSYQFRALSRILQFFGICIPGEDNRVFGVSATSSGTALSTRRDFFSHPYPTLPRLILHQKKKKIKMKPILSKTSTYTDSQNIRHHLLFRLSFSFYGLHMFLPS